MWEHFFVGPIIQVDYRPEKIEHSLEAQEVTEQFHANYILKLPDFDITDVL